VARASHPVVPAGAAERLIARVDDGPDNVVSFVRHGQARTARQDRRPCPAGLLF
jgi:hypothetical protein